MARLFEPSFAGWRAGLLALGVLSAVMVCVPGLRAPAEAAPRTPRLKPVAVTILPGLTEADSRRLARGFAAGSDGRWEEARGLAQEIRDPLARKLLEWRILAADNSAPSFFELQRGIPLFQDWPDALSIRTRAEQAAPFALSGAEAERFLLASGPRTSLGRAALALARDRQGKHSEALDSARAMWREERLDSLTESRFLASFGAALTAEDHASRVELMLWLGNVPAARRLLPRLESSDRIFHEAWIDLKTGARGAEDRLSVLSASARARPGILFERARKARRAEDIVEALRLMREISADDVPTSARSEIWEERRLLIGAALRDGYGREAYPIAAAHGLSAGEEFADAEWMSGWLALRKLNEPARAGQHFATLEAKVGTAVSLARARYWRAIASKAAGDPENAALQFAAAANFPTTFYGQMAIVRGGLSRDLQIPGMPAPNAQDKAAFDAIEGVRAIRILKALGETGEMRNFFLTLDDQMPNVQAHALLSDLAREMESPALGVRTAKSGLSRGLIAEEAAFPLPVLPRAARDSRLIEPAMVLAITRQETEFDPGAVSSAGARGLMQLLPSTAAAVARKLGLTFKTAWLTEDPDYNFTLGAAHLDDLVGEFNGSYILAIAAYNAGASRSRQWVSVYGDPRGGNVDPVDWIESIPFSETRNYVQRVIENIQVYRSRLAGGPTPLTIEKDLRRGLPG